MFELADIICRHGSQFLQENPEFRRPDIIQAFEDIENCRTEVLGGHLYRCSETTCGEFVYGYHSCRNRHCPKCHADQTEAWLNQRRTELLPTAYFHLVFTVPGQLHAVILANQKILYPVLMQEAAAALKKLARDPRFLGGDIGILAVLHTWTMALLYHPHVHCLVPAGTLTPDQQWKPSNPKFLVPVKALSDIFRAKVRDAIKKAGLIHQVDPKAWKKRWVVYSRPAVAKPEHLLDYLARYLHRVAIPNSRIVEIDDQNVVISGCNRANKKETTTLTANEFLRRFCRHILPKGFNKVRYFGLWSPVNRKKLRQLQLLLGLAIPFKAVSSSNTQGKAKAKCPVCRKGHLIKVGKIPRLPEYYSPARAPPTGRTKARKIS